MQRLPDIRDRLRVRPARASDHVAIRTLIERATAVLLGRPYPPEDLAALRAAVRADPIEESRFFVVDLGGAVAGCGGWAPSGRDDGVAKVRSIYADPDLRGRGIGSAVLARVESDCAEAGFTELELHATPDGRALYERRGWVAEGDVRLTGPSGGGFDITRMRKRLAERAAAA